MTDVGVAESAKWAMAASGTILSAATLTALPLEASRNGSSGAAGEAEVVLVGLDAWPPPAVAAVPVVPDPAVVGLDNVAGTPAPPGLAVPPAEPAEPPDALPLDELPEFGELALED